MKDCIDSLIETLLSEAPDTNAEPWALQDSGDLDARRVAWKNYFDNKLAGFRQAKADAKAAADQQAKADHDALLATIDKDKAQKYQDLFNQGLIDTEIFHDAYDNVLKKMGMFYAFKELDRDRFENRYKTGKYFIPGLLLNRCNQKAPLGLFEPKGSYQYIKDAEQKYGKDDPIIKLVKDLWVAQFKNSASYKLISSKMIDSYNKSRDTSKQALDAFNALLDRKGLEKYNSLVDDEDKINIQTLDDASIEDYDGEYGYGHINFTNGNGSDHDKNLYNTEDAKKLATLINKEIVARMKAINNSKSNVVAELTSLVNNNLDQLREATYLVNNKYYSVAFKRAGSSELDNYIQRRSDKINKDIIVTEITQNKDIPAELSSLEGGKLIRLDYAGMTHLAEDFTEVDFDLLYGGSQIANYKTEILSIAKEDKHIDIEHNPLNDSSIFIYSKETVVKDSAFVDGFNRWFSYSHSSYDGPLD